MCLAIPGRVEEVSSVEGLRTGKVRFGGLVRTVILEHAPEADVGKWVLVHVGVAISVMDEEEAKRTYALLESLGEAVGDDAP